MNTRRLHREVQETHQQIAQLETLRSEYQHTIDAYKEIYRRHEHEFNLQ